MTSGKAVLVIQADFGQRHGVLLLIIVVSRVGNGRCHPVLFRQDHCTERMAKNMTERY
jgi:hypothetical protein